MKLKSAGAVVVAGLILGAGCATESGRQAADAKARAVPQSVRLGDRMLMTLGVVIVKTEAGALYYKKQCQACGFVPDQQYGTTIPKESSTMRSAFTCPKCQHRQQSVIQID